MAMSFSCAYLPLRVASGANVNVYASPHQVTVTTSDPQSPNGAAGTDSVEDRLLPEAIMSIGDDHVDLVAVGQEGDWLKLEERGKYLGWARATVGELQPRYFPAVFRFSSTLPAGCSLRVRSQPSIDGNELKTVSAGMLVHAIGLKGDWLRVLLPQQKQTKLSTATMQPLSPKTTELNDSSDNKNTREVVGQSLEAWMMCSVNSSGASGTTLLVPVVPTLWKFSPDLPADSSLRVRSFPKPDAEQFAVIPNGMLASVVDECDNGQWLRIVVEVPDDHDTKEPPRSSGVEIESKSVQIISSHPEAWIMAATSDRMKLLMHVEPKLYMLSPALPPRCSLRIRSAPNAEAKTRGTITGDERVKAIDIKGNWIRLLYGSITTPAWMMWTTGTNDLLVPDEGVEDHKTIEWPRYFRVIVSGPLHVRSTPTDEAQSIAQLTKDVIVRGVSERGQWIRIEYKSPNNEAWVLRANRGSTILKDVTAEGRSVFRTWMLQQGIYDTSSQDSPGFESLSPTAFIGEGDEGEVEVSYGSPTKISKEPTEEPALKTTLGGGDPNVPEPLEFTAKMLTPPPSLDVNISSKGALKFAPGSMERNSSEKKSPPIGRASRSISEEVETFDWDACKGQMLQVKDWSMREEALVRAKTYLVNTQVVDDTVMKECGTLLPELLSDANLSVLRAAVELLHTWIHNHKTDCDIVEDIAKAIMNRPFADRPVVRSLAIESAVRLSILDSQNLTTIRLLVKSSDDINSKICCASLATLDKLARDHIGSTQICDMFDVVSERLDDCLHSKNLDICNAALPLLESLHSIKGDILFDTINAEGSLVAKTIREKKLKCNVSPRATLSTPTKITSPGGTNEGTEESSEGDSQIKSPASQCRVEINRIFSIGSWSERELAYQSIAKSLKEGSKEVALKNYSHFFPQCLADKNMRVLGAVLDFIDSFIEAYGTAEIDGPEFANALCERVLTSKYQHRVSTILNELVVKDTSGKTFSTLITCIGHKNPKLSTSSIEIILNLLNDDDAKKIVKGGMEELCLVIHKTLAYGQPQARTACLNLLEILLEREGVKCIRDKCRLGELPSPIKLQVEKLQRRSEAPSPESKNPPRSKQASIAPGSLTGEDRQSTPPRKVRGTWSKVEKTKAADLDSSSPQQKEEGQHIPKSPAMSKTTKPKKLLLSDEDPISAISSPNRVDVVGESSRNQEGEENNSMDSFEALDAEEAAWNKIGPVEITLYDPEVEDSWQLDAETQRECQVVQSLDLDFFFFQESAEHDVQNVAPGASSSFESKVIVDSKLPQDSSRAEEIFLGDGSIIKANETDDAILNDSLLSHRESARPDSLSDGYLKEQSRQTSDIFSSSSVPSPYRGRSRIPELARKYKSRIPVPVRLLKVAADN